MNNSKQIDGDNSQYTESIVFRAKSVAGKQSGSVIDKGIDVTFFLSLSRSLLMFAS